MLKKILFMLGMGAGLVAHGQYIPAGFPDIDIVRHDSTSLCDYLFVSLVRLQLPSPKPSNNAIFDRNGDLVWYYPTWDNVVDFQAQPQGFLSYYEDGAWQLLDSNFNVVRTVGCVGRDTDPHEILLRDDGHAFLLCHDDSTMNLTAYETAGGFGGSLTGTVRVQAVQELDPAGNLVREWTPWGQIALRDMDSLYYLSPGFMDLTHTNAMDFDSAGRILLSHRHLNELMLVDWTSGQVEWRMGGEKTGFAHGAGTIFSGQHIARFAPGGRITLYDNGNNNQPHVSRGLSLFADTVGMTVALDREWLEPEGVSSAMGSFQALPDGRFLLNLGQFTPLHASNLSFLNADGNLGVEVNVEDLYITYRAMCHSLPWSIRRPEIVCSVQGSDLVLQTAEPAAEYEWSTGQVGASIVVSDTGRYQVFVPAGIGYIGSEVLEIRDLGMGCPMVGMGEALSGNGGGQGQATGTYDLLGRPVQASSPVGTIVVERYRDGTARKRVVWK